MMYYVVVDKWEEIKNKWKLGHQQAVHTTASSASPPLTAQPSPLTPEDQHRELDDLLTDMLLTVENIPDVTPRYR